ncbi:MAG: hypothetical protein Q4F57_08285 [Weeksellaceae bacterium]|nr:hypothetical protein [Weeksellaceae bacterium]
MIDATKNCFKPLSTERLFDWHAALFQMGRRGIFKISVADWRQDTSRPMQVLSGAAGREKFHFQAPNAKLIESEMNRNSKILMNERQKKVLNKLLDGFEGKLTSMKWTKIAKCSKDTAIRDINDLIAKDILQKEPAGGRSTNYELKART